METSIVLNYDTVPEAFEDRIIHILFGMIALTMKQCDISTIELDNRLQAGIKEIEYQIDGYILKLTPKFKGDNSKEG
jgi:hypothetical protein